MMTESLDNIVIDNINIEIKSILHINSTLEPVSYTHLTLPTNREV